MNLYIVDYWVPFPSSEYGGLLIFIAKDRKELLELIEKENRKEYASVSKEKLLKYATQATEFPLVEGNWVPSLVDAFIT